MQLLLTRQHTNTHTQWLPLEDDDDDYCAPGLGLGAQFAGGDNAYPDDVRQCCQCAAANRRATITISHLSNEIYVPLLGFCIVCKTKLASISNTIHHNYRSICLEPVTTKAKQQCLICWLTHCKWLVVATANNVKQWQITCLWQVKTLERRLIKELKMKKIDYDLWWSPFMTKI